MKPFTPKTGVEVLGVEWPKAKSFNWKNDVWRFRIQTDEQATYEASLVRVGATRPALVAAGELRRRYFVFVKFPCDACPRDATPCGSRCGAERARRGRRR